MNNSERRHLLASLTDCGAEEVSLEKNGHYKLKFSKDGNKSRIIAIASTPSDRRAWKNMVSTIRNELERIGLVDQRFMPRLILTSVYAPRPQDAIWNLLDEWEQDEPNSQPPKPDADPAK